MNTLLTHCEYTVGHCVLSGREGSDKDEGENEAEVERENVSPSVAIKMNSIPNRNDVIAVLRSATI